MCITQYETKPIVRYTPTAYLKLTSLLHNYTTEVGWHGTVNKISENEYEIDDIFVYPQIVGPATVDTDDIEYTKWLNSLPDDVFSRLRYHGHSHVMMGVFASGVDMNHRNDIISAMPEDKFWIFGIYNKKNQAKVSLYTKEGGEIREQPMRNIADTRDFEIRKFLESAKNVIERK